MIRLALVESTKDSVALALRNLAVGDALAIDYGRGAYLTKDAKEAASLAKVAANMLGVKVKVVKKGGYVLVNRVESVLV